MDKNKKHCILCFILLSVSIIILVLINLLSGSVSYTMNQVAEVIFGKTSDSKAVNIILRIRLPRILAAIILGGAVSLSGFLLQTFFGNPIAGPFVLGISSGAKLTVAVTMIFTLGNGIILNSAGLVMASATGSVAAMGFVLIISSRMKKSSMLIVSGVMTGYICSAITDFIVVFADDSDIVNLHNWSMGSFAGIDIDDVRISALIVFSALIYSFMLSKQISAYQLGETHAQNMGVNIRIFRIELILLSSILSACVTAFAGPVSFVGIAVPHLIKNFFKTSKPLIIIPASFMGGSTFCLICDLISRTIFAPAEISISSVTAVFGAPIVIFIMLKRRTTVNG